MSLGDLIKAVEQGRWPHPVPFGHGYEATVGGLSVISYGFAFSAFHGSLDAAKALHDAMLPGWNVKTIHQFEAGHWHVAIYQPMGEAWPKWTQYPSHEAVNDDPARAWLLAILRALEAEGRG
jgi:hypothetical protein